MCTTVSLFDKMYIIISKAVKINIITA